MKPASALVVDDDRDFAESIADYLEGRGHHVTLAHSGEAAVDIFRQRDFDVTFMDVRLPGMDGVSSFFEFCRIRPDARVVVMTAYSIEDVMRRAIDGGALGVLQKPFEMARLLENLEAARSRCIVLVVDDDSDFVESLESYLKNQRIAVFVAHTGKEAVNKVLAARTDVLVLDLRLPVLSGLEVYMELKRLNRDVPTIIVTGYAVEEAEAIDELRALSVAGCLTKPFDPKDLLTLIETIPGGLWEGAGQRTEAGASLASAKTLRVLVADSDKTDAAMLRDMLEARRHRVTAAESGNAAVRSLRNNDFDITFMDIMLAGAGGMQTLLECLRVRPEARVIVTAARGAEERARQAVDRGAKAVLRKPFDADQLVQLIREILAKGD